MTVLDASANAPVGRLDDSPAFETFIADLSSRFISLAPEEVDREIESSLGRLCEASGLDMAVLWQWSPGERPVIVPTHAFPPLATLILQVPGEENYPWVIGQMLAGRSVIVPTLDALPPEAGADRASAERAGIKSNLTVPLGVGGDQPVGALAVNMVRGERRWSDVEVRRLGLVAQVVANALARKRADALLRESQLRLSMAAEAAQAGLWTFDYATGVFSASAFTRSIFGFAADEVITVEALRALVVPEDWHIVAEAIERAAAAGTLVHVEYRFTYRGERRPRWIAARGDPAFRPDGTADHLRGICFDVTERRRADESLRVSQARLEAGAELAELGFYEVDFTAGEAFVDDRARELLGLAGDPKEGLDTVSFWEAHLHPEDGPLVLGRRRRLHAGEIACLSMEYRYLHPQRGERWLQHQVRLGPAGPGAPALRTYGVLRDITELKRAEEEMRALSRRLLRAQEAERALLARELHDDVTQRLAVLAIDVGRVGTTGASGEHGAGLGALRDQIVKLSEDIHSLAYQLHPSVLEELGLVEALRVEGERRTGRGGLEVRLDLEPPPEGLSGDTALCLLRIAQESLTNVARHAAAKVATVTLRAMDGGLALAIADDGIGFDPLGPRRKRNLGLVGMRERLQLVNGTFDVESAPGRGTTVVAWVPVDGGQR